MTVGSRIREFRKKLGLSVDDVAEKLGKNRATIYRYESDDIENPPAPILEPLEKVLKTTPAELMGWEQSPAPAPDALPSLPAKDGTFPLNDIHRVPIIGTVRCGPGGLAYEHIDEYMTIDASYNPDEMRGFRAEGDSMIGDGIHDGDLCLIRLQPEVEKGVIAVVVIDDEEGCLKHVTVDKTNGVVVLSSSNPAYPQRVFTGPAANDVRIVGKLIEVRHRF